MRVLLKEKREHLEMYRYTVDTLYTYIFFTCMFGINLKHMYIVLLQEKCHKRRGGAGAGGGCEHPSIGCVFGYLPD